MLKFSKAFTYDTDASTYIEAVEAADGQALEQKVRLAINNFIIGCKNDGIWDAIKASCVMAGARTLAGALVPLKGTAPTNYNFVSGDYDRKTGLKGDGSTKYLDSNRNNNADPQNNKHFSAYIASNENVTQAVMAARVAEGNDGQSSLTAGAGTAFAFRVNSATAFDTVNQAGYIGFLGATRSSPTLITARAASAYYSGSAASQAPAPFNTFIFSRNNGGSAELHSPFRLSFYSIGESLDLALLDARVSGLMSDIKIALDGVTDPDARAYIEAVEAADGELLEYSAAQAIEAFIKGCKADNTWNSIKSCCIMAGARTLAGALVPLKGAAPTNYNFVSGDYDRKTGLKGNGSTKYLDSNRNNNADPRDNKHLSFYAASTLANTNPYPIGVILASNVAGVGAEGIYLNSVDYIGNTIGGGPHTAAGLHGAARSTSSGIVAKRPTLAPASYSLAATSAPANPSFVFALNNSGSGVNYSDARLSFYSIGEALDLALMDARVTALMNELRWGLDGITDPDAISYLQAVETADGQTLETGTRQAIQSFIIGCKADGIWNSIKSCCIMAGARTLAGALVPLKGTAPTNYNFVSGDYNRKTGLKGDGSTKYLDSGRNNNADPQNNKHLSTFVSYIAPTTTVFLATSSVDPGASWVTSGGPSGLGDMASFRANQASSTAIAEVGQSMGFRGVSRSNSSEALTRVAGATASYSVTSNPPTEEAILVFNGAGQIAPASARLSFYSIGESLDLALLDARVTALMNALSAVTDPDAIAYIAAVEAADGQPLETNTRLAIETFIVGCKADGIWDAIKASCVMAGARTLAGALVPLKGTAPTNFNFVSGDYDRKTGLKGDGSTKYLDSNTLDTATPQDSAHISVYQTTWTSGTFLIGVRNSDATPNTSQINANSASPQQLTGQIKDKFTTTPLLGHIASATFAGFSRSNSSDFTGRALGVTTLFSGTSAASVARTYHLFSSNNGSGSAFLPSNARLSFYSIGEALDLALLDARVATLMSTFSSVIP